MITELKLMKILIFIAPYLDCNSDYSYYIYSTSLIWLIFRRHGQVVRQGSAKPLSPVRIWVPPPTVKFQRSCAKSLRVCSFRYYPLFDFTQYHWNLNVGFLEVKTRFACFFHLFKTRFACFFYLFSKLALLVFFTFSKIALLVFFTFFQNSLCLFFHLFKNRFAFFLYLF